MRTDIQFYRGIAVVLVVFYHLKIPFFTNGFLGVDLFFVLSGFLMGKLCERYSKRQFIERRCTRLIPAYLVTLIATVIIVLLIAETSDANQFLNQLWFHLSLTSNIGYWFGNSYFDSAAFKPLLNLWSLGVEFQFYLLAPFLLPILKNKIRLNIVLIFLSIVLAFVINNVSPKTSFFLLPTRLWEFLVGASSAWLLLNMSGRVAKSILVVCISLISLILVAYPIDPGIKSPWFGHPGLASLLIVAAFAILLNVNQSNVFNRKNLISRVLITIGDYSYAIYLTHFPIIVLLNYIPYGGTKIGADNIKVLVLFLLLTAFTSYFIRNRIEKLRYNSNVHLISCILFIFALLLAVFGTNLIKHSNNLERSMILSAWEDRSEYRCGKLFRLISPFKSTCRVSDQKFEKNILLLGNSHADAIKTVVASAMAQKGISTHINVVNQPLIAADYDTREYQKYVSDGSIDYILVHYDKNYYNDRIKTQHLLKFKNFVQSLGIDVFFLAPVPYYKINIARQLLLEFDSGADISNYSVMDINEYNKSISQFRIFIEEYGISKDNVIYVADVMCPKGVCILQQDFQPLYFDNSHLTLTGANVLKPLLLKLASTIERD